jgi:hypothetical protein
MLALCESLCLRVFVANKCSKVLNVQVSDTTDDDRRYEARKKYTMHFL